MSPEHDSKDWKHSAGCETCKKERKDGWVPQIIYVGIVPGGSKDTAEVKWRRDFGPGLDAYKQARDEGLQPDHSDLKSVEMAHKRVKSQEQAIRKIKNYADIDGLKTTPGVNRDV